MKQTTLLLFLTFIPLNNFIFAQSEREHSVAREWNEVLLTAIRNDFARPTVHARNLFHISSAMYDAWCLTTKGADTYFMQI